MKPVASTWHNSVGALLNEPPQKGLHRPQPYIEQGPHSSHILLSSVAKRKLAARTVGRWKRVPRIWERLGRTGRGNKAVCGVHRMQ